MQASTAGNLANLNIANSPTNPPCPEHQPKKRGRPRKNKIIEKPYHPIEKKKIKSDNENREIILCLPISRSKSLESEKTENPNDFDISELENEIELDLNKPDKADKSDKPDKFDKSDKTDKPDKADKADKPDKQSIVNFELSDRSDIEDDSDNDETNILKNDQLFTISDQDSGDEVDLRAEIRKRDKVIKKLTGELAAAKASKKDDYTFVYRDVKTTPMKIAFVHTHDSKPVILEHTDVACWWCTYTFNNIPCFIPDKYSSDTFYVFGCFCSFNCAMAYNLGLGDYKVSERTSLIRKLYYTLKGTNDDIPIAPQREILTKFGGHVTIEEFRNVSNIINRDYKLKLPPLINLIACVEEIKKDHSSDDETQETKVTKVSGQNMLSANDKNIIPVKKKILHNTDRQDIIGKIGIKEKTRRF